MESIIKCFAFNDEAAILDTYDYYISMLSDKWDLCQRRILAQRLDYVRYNVIKTIKKRFDMRTDLTEDSSIVSQMRQVIRNAKNNPNPVNIEEELQKIIKLDEDKIAFDLTWNRAGVIAKQSNKLLFEYQPYVEAKLAKIEKIWETEHKIAVNTILKTLVYISYLDCGSTDPLLYVKRWGINYDNINLSDEIWESIYPVFESKNDENILTYLNGIMNGIIFINVNMEGCASNSIEYELERIVDMKEVFYNMDYINQLHLDLLSYDFSSYKQRGRPRLELSELKSKYGFDLILNVAMIGYWLILHDCSTVPYKHRDVDSDYVSIVSKYLSSISINWDSYRGELYHIINVFFSSVNHDDMIHNGSDFSNLFGIGYNESLILIENGEVNLALNKIVIWYTTHVLHQLKSIR